MRDTAEIRFEGAVGAACALAAGDRGGGEWRGDDPRILPEAGDSHEPLVLLAAPVAAG